MGTQHINSLIAIDFFCGGGGITKGLSDAGIKVLGGIDISPDLKRTYEENNHNKFVNFDIRTISGSDIYKEFPEIEGNEDNLLLAGCAPCQPFSKQRRANTEHVDKDLLTEFGRIVKDVLPAHLLIENVPGLMKKGHSVLENFLKILDECNYSYDYKVVNANDYGVPQKRKRLVIIASRLFIPKIPDGEYGPNKSGKKPYVTVRDAILRYPPIQAGESADGVPNHSAACLNDKNLTRIRATPHDGGDRRSWSSELVLDCHKGKPGHTDVYGRMAWDDVAPTLTSRCASLSNGRYGHPEQDRAISLREAAALQTFPDNYIFYGNNVSVGKQIGNAVPVKLAEVFGEYILSNSKK